jgi:oxygen-independent coproporphyrinogen-3 oxidase
MTRQPPELMQVNVTGRPRGHIAAMGVPEYFDAELLRRYDRPGPRYTSYPTAPQFGPQFDERKFREVARRSNSEPIPSDLSLYVHVPFCFSPCFYCGCTRIITRDRARGALYLSRLMREIEIAAPLFDRDRDVIQLHFGGGTPNFLDAGELSALIGGLGRHFHFSDRADRDFSIELDPRTLATGDVRRLAELGLNRASLGVQDFDPEVQQAVNRIQGVEQTLAVIDECRASGMRSVNVDLIYGLPKQTLDGFARTLDALLAVRPDRLAVYGYAHLPELFKAQRQIEAADLPDAALRLELLQLAVQKLTDAGYRFIGMDHFALPADDLSKAQSAGSLHRNFMGYTIHDDCDLVGFGVSSISHVGDSFSQNFRDLPTWERALDEGRLPVWRGIELDADDVLRADVIQQLMCQGEIDAARVEERYGIDFRAYFADSLAKLAPLAADGLVTVEPLRIAATSRGRYLLRIIAMCFDRYLAAAQAPRYSKAI